MPRLGIGYEQLKTINPKIVMLSISGFGSDGPESRRATYAPVIHAEAGLMYRSKQRTDLPHHDLPLSVADTNASLHGLVGLLSAIIMRDRTGLGQHIDIAMLDATIATDDQIHYDLENSRDTAGLSNEIAEMPFGPVLLSTDFRIFFKLLTTKLGLVDPSKDGMSLEQKIASRRAAVADFLSTLDTRDKLDDAMKTLNIAWGEIRDPAKLEQQITVKARGSITQIDDRQGGTRPITQSPYRFSNAQSGVQGPASHRGEHNSQVLKDWLGREDAQPLHENGVLVFDPNWDHH
jgi:CoA:oxalate CoA-transferase